MKPGLLMLPSAVSNSRVHNILPNKIETDFQFSRASAATRVNHQGLIENVGYFSDELVQNGNFSELGPELITNGDFATDSDWNKGIGWSINNGKAVGENAGSPSASYLTQNFAFVSGKTYKVVYTVSEYVKGTFRPQLATPGSQNLPNITGNGTYTEYIVANNNFSKFRFRAATTDGGFTGKIDNVSVKQVDPDNDWILGTGWSFSDNKVVFDGGADAAITQNNTVEPSTLYRASFTVADKTTGSLQLRLGNSAVVDVTVTDNGNFSFDLTTDASGTSVYFRAIGGFNGSLSNVSVKQILGDKPRLDYDPTNPTCPHLLLEPQSTNLVAFSEDFSQSVWNTGTSRSYILTATNDINPTGLALSYKFESTAADNQFAYYHTTTIGTTITNSIYVKRVSGTGVVKLRNVNNIATDFNLSVADGWKRINVTATATSTIARFYLNLGDIGDEILIFGAQQEALSYATSYIPTAGATETRIGESCFIPGIDNGILNQNAFTLLLDTSILNNTVNNFLELIILYNSSNPSTTNLRFESRTNGQVYVQHQNCVNSGNNFNSATFGSNSVDFKNFLISCSTSEVKIWADGNKINDYSGSYVFAFDRIGFRNNTGIVETILKHNAVALYNRVLTDTESYTITSTQYSAYSGMVAALGNYTIPC